MDKSSTATIRETTATPAASGEFSVHAGTLTVDTSDRLELVDLTDAVVALVRRSGVQEGLISLWSLHTTCAVFINEMQRALHADIKAFLERAVERHHDWMHNDPDHSDCDRMNADAHLRAILLGPGLTLQITAGEIVLGQYQRILLAELDGPRERSVRAQAMGI